MGVGVKDVVQWQNTCLRCPGFQRQEENGYKMLQVQAVVTRATTEKPLKTALDTLPCLNLECPWEKLFMSLQPRKLRLKRRRISGYAPGHTASHGLEVICLILKHLIKIRCAPTTRSALALGLI